MFLRIGPFKGVSEKVRATEEDLLGGDQVEKLRKVQVPPDGNIIHFVHFLIAERRNQPERSDRLY